MTDLINRADALKARTLWMQIDGEGRIDSICTAPFPGHDAYISYLAIEAIPAVTTPDPRDEVIKRLVEALEEIASITVHSGGDVHGVTSRKWQGAFQQAQDEARAALAAAKAVQP